MSCPICKTECGYRVKDDYDAVIFYCANPNMPINNTPLVSMRPIEETCCECGGPHDCNECSAFGGEMQ